MTPPTRRGKHSLPGIVFSCFSFIYAGEIPMNIAVHIQSACLCARFLWLACLALGRENSLPPLLRAHALLQERRKLLAQAARSAAPATDKRR
jgi:hypothetical protein